MKLPPLSLYVHIPWCVRKCPYCDFNSHETRVLPEQNYVQALLADLAEDRSLTQGRPLQSIFFGGGTPSLFQASSIDAILRGIKAQVPWAPDIEITLEANPGTTEYNNLEQLRRAGVNRLSLGVQSFNTEHLQTLGRIHGPEEVHRAFAQARQAGFDNINLDLMHGLPRQTQTQALVDLEIALTLQPEHLSWYQLTIEPNTIFHQKPPQLPVDDVLAAIQEAGHQLLGSAGFQQYEVSAFCQSGRTSRHNINYWQYGDYLAIGAGAHGKVTGPDGQVHRYRKTRMPAHYLDAGKAFTADSQSIAAEERPLEFMMNALRLVDGVPSHYFTERTGVPLTAIEQPRRRLIAKGMMSDDTQYLRTTKTGLLFLNNTLAEFM